MGINIQTLTLLVNKLAALRDATTASPKPDDNTKTGTSLSLLHSISSSTPFLKILIFWYVF